MKNKLKFVIITLVLFLLISWFASIFVSFFVEIKPSGNIALIPIKGIILADPGSGMFGDSVASSTETVKFIQDADKDPSIKGILFEINSPGGSAVASKEIADAIKRTNKSTFSVIREVGASGAYWVASATDHIIANELSITGSVGVISSYIEFEGLLRRYNLTYQRLTAGEYKDLGDPFKKLEQDERTILQLKLNKIHDYFIKEVAENRNLQPEAIKQISTAQFYLGVEAYDLGLVDSLGDLETAKQTIKQKLNLTQVEFAEYTTEKTLIEMLAGVFSEQFFFVGKGIGSALTDTKATNQLEIFT